ncbi:MAG: hypothetical protein ACXVPN_08905 [Bacteroidia bacterium]
MRKGFFICAYLSAQVLGALEEEVFEYAAHLEAASLCFVAEITNVELLPPVTLHSQVYCLLQPLAKVPNAIIVTEKKVFMVWLFAFDKDRADIPFIFLKNITMPV